MRPISHNDDASGAPRIPTGWSSERMLVRLAGDVDLARQMVEIFVSVYPEMIGNLRTAVDQGSAEAVRRAAHTLKGSTLNFTDGGPAATSFELETMGREGHLEGAPGALARLEREMAALLDELRQYQAGLRCKS